MRRSVFSRWFQSRRSLRKRKLAHSARAAAAESLEMRQLLSAANPSLDYFIADTNTDEMLIQVESGDRVDPALVEGRSITVYAVASNAPLNDILRASEDLRQRITVPQVIRNVGTNVLDSQSFARALMRIRADQDLYQVLEGAVDISSDTLFNTSIELPANLTEGDYATRIFLTRDGTVIDTYETAIPVKKVGLERWLYNLSRENAFLYGLMSLAIAIAAGWTASAAFSLLRP